MSISLKFIILSDYVYFIAWMSSSIQTMLYTSKNNLKYNLMGKKKRYERNFVSAEVSLLIYSEHINVYIHSHVLVSSEVSITTYI